MRSCVSGTWPCSKDASHRSFLCAHILSICVSCSLHGPSHVLFLVNGSSFRSKLWRPPGYEQVKQVQSQLAHGNGAIRAEGPWKKYSTIPGRVSMHPISSSDPMVQTWNRMYFSWPQSPNTTFFTVADPPQLMMAILSFRGSSKLQFMMWVLEPPGCTCEC